MAKRLSRPGDPSPQTLFGRKRLAEYGYQQTEHTLCEFAKYVRAYKVIKWGQEWKDHAKLRLRKNAHKLAKEDAEEGVEPMSGEDGGKDENDGGLQMLRSLVDAEDVDDSFDSHSS